MVVDMTCFAYFYDNSASIRANQMKICQSYRSCAKLDSFRSNIILELSSFAGSLPWQHTGLGMKIKLKLHSHTSHLAMNLRRYQLSEY